MILGSESHGTYEHILLSDGSVSLQTKLIAESESELLYDWRFTANQFVLATSRLRLTAINFFQRKLCGHNSYVTSCLTRGWVCRLQLMLVLASAVILWSGFRATNDHILPSQIRDSLTSWDRFPYLYPPGTGWSSYSSRHWIPFSSLPTSLRLRPMVSRPVSLGIRHPSGTYDQIFVTVR
jgi:hypothetical protein